MPLGGVFSFVAWGGCRAALPVSPAYGCLMASTGLLDQLVTAERDLFFSFG